MRGSTHLAGALFAGALATGEPAGIAAAGVAGLMPDWLQLNIPGVDRLARGVTGHRGFSHWLLTAGVIGLAVRLALPGLGWAVLAGWLSHIALDLVSGGTPALWPVSKRITLAKIKTGSQWDSMVGGALLVLAVVFIVIRLV